MQMAPNGRVVTIPIGTSLGEAERLFIEATLRHCTNNVSQSAQMLGVHRSTLHNKITEYKLKRSETQ